MATQNGTPGRIRTADGQLRRLSLFRLATGALEERAGLEPTRAFTLVALALRCLTARPPFLDTASCTGRGPIATWCLAHVGEPTAPTDRAARRERAVLGEMVADPGTAPGLQAYETRLALCVPAWLSEKDSNPQ